MTRAAIYVRISRDYSGEEKGVERQEEDCLALAQRRGFSVDSAHIYRDNDISASTRSKKVRPAYNAMIAAVDAGDVDVVIAYSNSRLTRRPAEWIELISRAETGRLKIETCVSGKHDLTTADGRAVALTVAAWDAAEAERIAERTKRKFEQNRRDGIPRNAGGNRLYGFDGTKAWHQIPGEMAIVRETYERTLRGETGRSITIDYRARGLTTTSGKEWDWYATNRILKNSLYMGRLSYKGKVTEIPAKLPEPPIVTEAEWLAVNRILEGRDKGYGKRTTRADGRKPLLAGLLFCGKCHGRVIGRDLNYYACAATLNGCGGLSVKRSALEEIIENYVKTQLFHNPKSTSARTTSVEAAIAKAAALAEREASIEHEISATSRLIVSGDLAVVDGSAILSGLRAELVRVRTELADLAPTAALEDYDDVHEYDNQSVDLRRAEIKRHITSVTVNPADPFRKRRFQPGRVEIVLASGEQVGGGELVDRSYKFGTIPAEADAYAEASKEEAARRRLYHERKKAGAAQIAAYEAEQASTAAS